MVDRRHTGCSVSLAGSYKLAATSLFEKTALHEVIEEGITRRAVEAPQPLHLCPGQAHARKFFVFGTDEPQPICVGDCAHEHEHPPREAATPRV